MNTEYKKCGFRFLDNEAIEFYCEPSSFTDYNENEDIYISGTFNGWLNTGNSDWKLEKKVTKNIIYFVLQKPIKVVLVPGNTGFPEFRFFALSSSSYHLLTDKAAFKKYSFYSNRLIFKDAEDLKEIDRLNEKIQFKKSLVNFDLDCPACRADIANIRIVPGTECLFRGYNPFKRSKPAFDTEDKRIEFVQSLYKLYGIKSDITLNGYEGPSINIGESMPEFLKKIEEKENRLCIDIDYNLVYFHPDAVDYSCALRKIAVFIISHPGPYYIHCRLGSDRTGVTCGILAALCGASWKEIAYDYERTSNMGVEEYRNRKLLQYSFTKMLNKNPADVKDLAHLMQSYFIKENILKMEEINTLIKKLNAPIKKTDCKYFNFEEKHICAKQKANL